MNKIVFLRLSGIWKWEQDGELDFEEGIDTGLTEQDNDNERQTGVRRGTRIGLKSQGDASSCRNQDSEWRANSQWFNTLPRTPER